MSLNSRVLFPVCVAAIGGFLFGYDTAVISGAIGYLQTHFGLNDVSKGWAASSALVGCIPGAMFAGPLSDRFGRKAILIVCAVLYLLSGGFSAIPPNFAVFIAARFLGGLAIGACSMVCPVYIAEISPEKIRGQLGTLFQFGVVVGIFLVFFVNSGIHKAGTETWNLEYGWRYMLGSEAIPAAVFLVLIFFVPESPRWLLQRNRVEEARAIQMRIDGQELSRDEIASTSETGRLLAPENRRPLLIAVGLMAFSQFSGINAIMYYAPEIFKASGTGEDAAFSSAVYIGFINLVFTLVATAFVDKGGRRSLLLIGVAVQTVALLLVGLMFAMKISGLALLVCILAFVAAFAMSLGPIPWIISSEIFDNNVRGKAMSAATFTIWTCATIVAQTFPWLNSHLGGAATFWTFGAFSLASLVFVFRLVPETKGRTLEEIARSWRR